VLFATVDAFHLINVPQSHVHYAIQSLNAKESTNATKTPGIVLLYILYNIITDNKSQKILSYF